MTVIRNRVQPFLLWASSEDLIDLLTDFQTATLALSHESRDVHFFFKTLLLQEPVYSYPIFIFNRIYNIQLDDSNFATILSIPHKYFLLCNVM